MPLVLLIPTNCFALNAQHKKSGKIPVAISDNKMGWSTVSKALEKSIKTTDDESYSLQSRNFDQLTWQFHDILNPLTETLTIILYKPLAGMHCCIKSLWEKDKVYEVKLKK